MNTRILLLDDHAIMLDGLEAVLKAEPGLEVVTKLTDPVSALSFAVKNDVHLIITDYAMPDMDGAEFTRRVKLALPGVRIIVLSMHDEPHIISEILRRGVDGYILKKYAQQELIHAIDAVMSGRQYWSREVSTSLLRASQTNLQTAELTDREIEILKLLTNALSTKEISNLLFISERTVETHRKNLLRKTNAGNTAGLVKYAYEHKYC